MKRFFFVTVLGLIGGLLAHFGWLAAHGSSGRGLIDDQLSWMKTELRLSAAQYDRIKALHEQSSPHLRALAQQVTRMRAEFAAFELERQTTGEVDFIAFAQFVDERRAIDRECAESSRRLIVAAIAVMTPRQRDQYCAALLHSAPRHDQALN